MDISAITNKAHKPDEEPEFAYTAQAESLVVSGEAKVVIKNEGFTASTLFDAVHILFAEINAIKFSDYAVIADTDSGVYRFSKMGEWAERFYNALLSAYNKAVLRSLFVNGKPLVTAKGEFNYNENGAVTTGNAPLYVYDDCIVVLPPNTAARRIPLAFATGLIKGDYTFTLNIGADESYTFSKLGYDTEPFVSATQERIRAAREEALAAVKAFCSKLSPVEAAQISKIMFKGASASLSELNQISQTYTAAVEEQISKTHVAEYYAALKVICEPSRICIGYYADAKPQKPGLAEGMAQFDNHSIGGEQTAENGKKAFFIIAPSKDGKHAVVEFEQADTATFVYLVNGGFDIFVQKLCRAMEAVGFRREVIRLSDEELLKPENSDYYMAAKRVEALRFIRANCIGRVIHSNSQTWAQKLTEYGFG